MYKQAINKILKRYETKTIPVEGKTVFLTFDDGPEPEITEFVLNNLDKYGFKATFFCRGDNAEKHSKLLALIRDKGHNIGNHTYNHLHAFETTSKEYFEDVEKANQLLHTQLFRPPHGSLTLSTFFRLRRKYRIFHWGLNSGDSDLNHFDFEKSLNSLKTRTNSGDIVLFHFCHRHEKETELLLPEYLKWLNEQGFVSKAITI